MLYREIIAVCSQIETKHVYALCRWCNVLGTFGYHDERLSASFCLSAVRPHGTNSLSLDGFSLNSLFEFTSKI